MRLLKVFVLAVAAIFLAIAFLSAGPVASQSATEAPTGFDNQTNGFISQAQFDADRAVFEEHETIADGLGPVFNADGCADCHFSPVSGGVSQIFELRAGRFDGVNFTDHPGGSLIQLRAIDASIQEHVADSDNVRAFRSTLNVLGDGFVEAIANSTLINIANNQPSQSGGQIAGQVVVVPVLEANNANRVGRFGWKAQHASLISFASDAYLNEMGITNPLFPTENTSDGRSVAQFDSVPDPEDQDANGNGVGDDVEAFARFMRATKAPPRDPNLSATFDAQVGEAIFVQIGCAICHVRTIQTSPPGTVINGGAFVVPPALGNKIIHPFSDFLLHDVGTGDGIVQNGGPSTRNKLRTPPLWGLRTHAQFMHDGQSLTLTEAILRHGGEATFVINNFRNLSQTNKNRLLTFLRSL